jgi:lipoprotein-releasing system permease protein
MKLEYFIAKRLLIKDNSGNNFSRPIVSVAVWGISIGLAVMILSVAIITGFKNEISEKVTGFASHIQIVNYDNKSSYETLPISKEQDWIEEVKSLPGVKSLNTFILKGGIIKTNEYIHGAVFKGLDSDYPEDFFNQYLIAGNVFNICDSVRNDSVIISEYIANALHLKIGDRFDAHFVQDPPRMRKFTVAGIYNTQLEELDQLFVFVDIKHPRRLNNWEEDQISGFEIYIEDFRKLFDYDLLITQIVGNHFTRDGSLLRVKNITDDYSNIFDWLSLLDMNVWVILGLMLAVAGFNMVSGLLVIILERVNMIGVLKSLGATNFSISKIFIYHAAILIFKGLLRGNIIGIGLCLIQYYTELIKLDPSSYYVAMVPINIDIIHILVLNIGTLLITVIMMVLPSFVVSKISPSEAIRFN